VAGDRPSTPHWDKWSQCKFTACFRKKGVDQRVTEILTKKRDLFDDFARISETAGSAPEAFDVSEADLARDVMAAERERLFSQGSASPTDDEEAV